MFTGIIESSGTINSAQRRGSSIVLSVRPDRDDFPVIVGGSVAIDGVCLTLERWNGSEMCFSAVMETLERSTLKNATTGRRVNLERAALIGSRLDGHFVYGHVDGTGTIVSDREAGGSTVRTFSAPPELSLFIAEKGSIAIDGISLTVASCENSNFTVSFIPHTLGATTMAHKRVGDTVNLECDIVARYLHRLMQAGRVDQAVAAAPGAQESLLGVLERAGF